MTYYTRGANAEREVKRILEDAGEVVVRSAGSLGLFDLVSVRPPQGYKPRAFRIRLIQVKSINDCAKGQARADAELQALLDRYPNHARAFEAWVRCKGGRWFVAIGDEWVGRKRWEARNG